jgi:hypothetical protein
MNRRGAVVYISSSWKQRERVRKVAADLLAVGYEVYDFTNPVCRTTPEIPPERFPDLFDPAVHDYEDYLRAVPEWRAAVECNREALDRTSVVVLLLPCGLDAHADAFYALGRGARLIVVGSPLKGERVPTHLWADLLVATDEEVVQAVKFVAKVGRTIPESYVALESFR